MNRGCFLIRHGTTRGNEARRYIGAETDEELSAGGVASVLSAKKKIRGLLPEKFVIVSSPLKRARETAAILFDNRDVIIFDDLKEMDFGRFEGKNYEELKDDPDYRTWIDSRGNAGCPGGENVEDFKERSLRGFYSAMESCSDGETLCIVCHGGSIMAILSILTGGEYYDFRVDPLCGYRLEMKTDDEGIHLIAYDRFDGGMPS